MHDKSIKNSFCYVFIFNNNSNNFKKKEVKMSYTKPMILAQSTVQMAQCRPNSMPSGRPCNPPAPGGR